MIDPEQNTVNTPTAIQSFDSDPEMSVCMDYLILQDRSSSKHCTNKRRKAISSSTISFFFPPLYANNPAVI